MLVDLYLIPHTKQNNTRATMQTILTARATTHAMLAQAQTMGGLSRPDHPQLAGARVICVNQSYHTHSQE